MEPQGQSAGEWVAIVDDANNVTGSATRGQMRAGNLIHRATYIFVNDPQGRLYVQQRTLTKDVYPGYWDLCAGGVVLAGETYEQSARRELQEELGIGDVPLTSLFHFYFEDSCRVWGAAYECTYEGPLQLQVEEVVSVERMSLDEVKASEKAFTPDSLFALRMKLNRTGA